MTKSLYQTVATNKEGVNGFVYLDDGTKHLVSSPLKQSEGTNPEQLLAASFATCLSETLRVLMLQKRERRAFRVDVVVDLVADEVEKGYQFLVHAKIGVDGLDLVETKVLLDETKKRCPVSRLLNHSANVSYEAVYYS